MKTGSDWQLKHIEILKLDGVDLHFVKNNGTCLS